MKKLLGTFVAVGAMALMAVGVQAATYSAGTDIVPQEVEDQGETIRVAKVPVMITPDNSGTPETVNAYILELTYDSNLVNPRVVGEDATGDVCYAEVGSDFNTENSVLVAGDVAEKADGTMKTLAVSWAAADPVEFDAEAVLANVDFKVEDAATEDVEIGVKAVAVTTSGEKIDAVDVVGAAGTITINTENTGIVYGEADGIDGISAEDASLVAKHAIGLIVLDDKYLANVDVDGVDGISAEDASMIARYALGNISSFPVESQAESN